MLKTVIKYSFLVVGGLYGILLIPLIFTIFIGYTINHYKNDKIKIYEFKTINIEKSNDLNATVNLKPKKGYEFNKANLVINLPENIFYKFKFTEYENNECVLCINEIYSHTNISYSISNLKNKEYYIDLIYNNSDGKILHYKAKFIPNIYEKIKKWTN